MVVSPSFWPARLRKPRRESRYARLAHVRCGPKAGMQCKMACRFGPKADIGYFLLRGQGSREPRPLSYRTPLRAAGPMPPRPQSADASRIDLGARSTVPSFEQHQSKYCTLFALRFGFSGLALWSARQISEPVAT